ncbi:MAG: serine/threonine-protein kinase [Byssovorax sp.]
MSDGAMPARLGRYEIVERLSAGGMGEVFVGRFVAPGGFVKPVAIKRIHPHLSEDEQFIHMLHDEANVAAAVKHPNIVGTIDVGAEGDSHYVVLDYVSGEPLSRLVRELKRRNAHPPQWLAAWIGAETASALHAAHEARTLSGEALEIVHRDVSLANVMLSDGGHPMLFDFGVAKAKQRIHHTKAGELKGKLAYMAPEAFQGAAIDRTIDVFALGVMLYELLTGRSPFQRETDLETIAALRSAVVPPPSAIVPQIDRRLDPIVMTAMARERAERYPTAAHVERALRAWAREAEVPHDAAAAARWMEATFPERIALRRALLSRVADLGQRPRGGEVHTPARGTPPPFTPGHATPAPAGLAAPHSGPYAAPPSGAYAAPISGVSVLTLRRARASIQG